MGQGLDKNPTKSTDLQVKIYNSIMQDGYQIKVPIPTENSRFLKTYICSHESKPGSFLVKLFIKSGNVDLKKHENEVNSNKKIQSTTKKNLTILFSFLFHH